MRGVLRMMAAGAALLCLAACAGMYVAGDAGPHRADPSDTTSSPR